MSTLHETFSRCPHDKENPYTMISRDLIRDQTISPECRWLLIYLLSNKEGWNIHIRAIINHCKGMMGRDKIYKIIKEAIAAGYILREEYFENAEIVKNGKPIVFKNLSRFRYFVAESPKFKKCLQLPENQEGEIPIPENTHSKEEASPKKEQIEVSPIVPKGDIPQKRKKVKEDKEERAPEVSTTKTQHDDLLRRLGNDQKKLLSCYEKLSAWKIGKQITGGNDYKAILNWVIKSIEEETQKCKPNHYQSKSNKCNDPFSARDTSEPLVRTSDSLADILNKCLNGSKKNQDSSSSPESQDVGKPIFAQL